MASKKKPFVTIPTASVLDLSNLPADELQALNSKVQNAIKNIKSNTITKEEKKEIRDEYKKLMERTVKIESVMVPLEVYMNFSSYDFKTYFDAVPAESFDFDEVLKSSELGQQAKLQYEAEVEGFKKKLAALKRKYKLDKCEVQLLLGGNL